MSDLWNFFAMIGSIFCGALIVACLYGFYLWATGWEPSDEEKR